MNRRTFVSAITAAIGGFALDPDRLLWVPGQRRYFDIHQGLELLDTTQVSIFDCARYSWKTFEGTLILSDVQNVEIFRGPLVYVDDHS